MAGYIGPIPVPQATQSRETFTATASQTSFGTAGYQVGYLDVFMNGVKLAPADFTATNGSDVVLASGAAVNDIIEVVSYSAFEVLNQNFTGTTTADNLTVTGNLTVDGTTTTINSTTLNVDDINITVASGAADSAAANGAGLTVDGAGATFNYSHSGTKWTMNKPLDVTGTITSDGLTVQAASGSSTGTIRSATGSNSSLYLDTQDTTSASYITASGALGIAAGSGTPVRMQIANNGDITFYETDGTTASFVYDANAGTTFNEAGADRDFRVESDGSTHALFVDAGNNRVGVLASAPRVPLEVGSYGTAVGMSETQIALAAFNGSVAAGLTFFDDNGEANAQQFYFDPGSCTLKLLTTTNGGTNKYNRMEIQGNAAGGEVSFNQDGQNHDFRVESDSNTHMLFVDAGGEYVNVNSSATYLGGKLNVSGNKGTGSGIPSSQLVVADFTALREGGGGAIQFNGIYDSNNSMTSAASIEAYKRNATSGDYGFGLWFKSRTNGGPNQERLYMDEDKTVFNDIGANTDFRIESDSQANQFYIDGQHGFVSIGKNSSAAGTNGLSFGSTGTSAVMSSSGSNNTWHTYSTSTNSYNFIVGADGTVSYVSLNQLSDEREKENIVDIPVGLEAVKQLRPCQFDWKAAEQGTNVYGFIAQEVESVIPTIVSEYKKSDTETRKSIKHVDLIAVLTKAMQEQQTLIETLEARITALENS